MNISKYGWVVAGALGIVFFAGGFQGKADKVGIVDMAKVFSDSDYAKAQTDTLRTLNTSRMDILQFLRTYPVFTPEQASRFKEISMKPMPSAPEKAELEKIKQDVINANKRFNELSTKPNPTPEEVNQLKEFVGRAQAMANTMDRWAHEFQDEVEGVQDKLRGETLDRVKAAVKEVGQKQGYTYVIVQDAAPYGANDITDEAKKAMNAKR
jgi:Skp family chaperone for outer membrane proteins